jgi:hypothetical protein
MAIDENWCGSPKMGRIPHWKIYPLSSGLFSIVLHRHPNLRYIVVVVATLPEPLIVVRDTIALKSL